MRDWRSGPQWDSRTLDELDGYQIKAECQGCNHVSYFDPEKLKRRQRRHYVWIAISPRLRCEECKQKMAKLTLEPAKATIKRISGRSDTVH